MTKSSKFQLKLAPKVVDDEYRMTLPEKLTEVCRTPAGNASAHGSDNDQRQAQRGHILRFIKDN